MGEKLTGVLVLNGCDHGMKLVTGSWGFLRGLAKATLLRGAQQEEKRQQSQDAAREIAIDT